MSEQADSHVVHDGWCVVQMVRDDGDRVEAELINSAQAAASCKSGSHKGRTIPLRVLNLLDVGDVRKTMMATLILTDDRYPTITIVGVGVYNESRSSKMRFKVITEILLKKMQVLRYDSVSMGDYGTLQDRRAFIFRVKQFLNIFRVKQFLKMKAPCSIETSGESCPKRQRHISVSIKNFTLQK